LLSYVLKSMLKNEKADAAATSFDRSPHPPQPLRTQPSRDGYGAVAGNLVFLPRRTER
jgi:hypothetical protein